jgi:hypothetical protein
MLSDAEVVAICLSATRDYRQKNELRNFSTACRNRKKQYMSPTLILGDIHGSAFWKTAVTENPHCRYIFLGDYLDPYQSVSRQKLLQYLQEIIQSSRFDSALAEKASVIFRDNFHLFQYAFREDALSFATACGTGII